ncbi:hypothetical protein RFI_12964 [Reticulomyxa filosa]|uniref:Uncharacterized protein n=1 Tax=Reticulomyxa filosa TaxID=46433 RepID=X6NCZ1_RETFI|nr:hypothetical protein RFI_12964 [Reticulomyxa filosa]|eukprot:ETO24195.1 hypothetical protein RFI_12964 [Reticulomyxa filosa]
MNFRWEHHVHRPSQIKSDSNNDDGNDDSDGDDNDQTLSNNNNDNDNDNDNDNEKGIKKEYTIFDQEKERFVCSILHWTPLLRNCGVLIVEYVIEDIRQKWYPDMYIKWLSEEQRQERHIISSNGADDRRSKHEGIRKEKQTVESCNDVQRLDCRDNGMKKLLKIKSSKDNLLSLVPESKDLLFKECLVFAKHTPFAHHHHHHHHHRGYLHPCADYHELEYSSSHHSNVSSSSSTLCLDPTQFIHDMVTDMLYDHRLLIVPPHPRLIGIFFFF